MESSALSLHPVLPLADLCLCRLAKSFPASDFLDLLPDYLRKRLFNVFKEKYAQETLTTLNFSFCKDLTDDEVKNIQHLRNLKTLNLSHTEQLTGISLHYVGLTGSVETLVLAHSAHVSVGLYFLAPLSATLRSLDVSFCEVQDPLVPFIVGLSNLTHLNLMCNRLSDEGVVQLGRMAQLEDLSISMNPLLTDRSLEALSSLSKLKHLNLNFCKLISSDGIDKLSRQLPHLSQLDIVGCDRALTEVRTRPLILLAEDSRVQARLISMVLNRYNFDVEVAANGEIALEMFRSRSLTDGGATHAFDLILMDVVMPQMDGIECAKLIREFERQHGLPRTPIIIQTADERDAAKQVALEGGLGDGFMTKPLDKSAIALARSLLESKPRKTSKGS